MTRKARNQVTNAQFFQMCDEMRTHREVLVKECRSIKEVIPWLEKRIGLAPSYHAVENALITVNIELDNRPKVLNFAGTSANKIISRALLDLFNKLGETAPADLIEVVDRLHKGNLAPAQAETSPESAPVLRVSTPAPVNGIPVRTVVDPKTINVVKK